ncbi:MAG: penicillin-binding protein 2 [Betaproteobacteria bacterium AqS2]|uniref:Penicillin-binding protein 2 n=1 Tax=Candidatus Amphirhobacter heronislandensis TaxID=1732024 RepID=A0A930UH39_9GAMM|nr:penicillin-binding protein 2 [Betaproteobacteria bacterium AqS2]
MLAAGGERDERRVRRSFLARLALLGLAVTGLGLGLVWRWHYLQVERYEHFEELAVDNQFALERVGPIRGLIRDRHGVALAENNTRYLVRVNSDNAARTLERLDELGAYLPLAPKAAAKLEEAARSPVYAGEIVISDYLRLEDLLRFIDVQHLHPEAVLDARLLRSYPHGDFAAHVIGHVGRINAGDVARLRERRRYQQYVGSDFIGKRGVEAMYETRLHGAPGLREVHIDAHGRVLDTLHRLSPTTGADLWLTLDGGLQQKAEELLEGKEGALVALEPYTGEILALASAPRFDVNDFIGGVTQKQWEELNSTERGAPMVHRAIYGQYAPGSTLKPFLALAALDEGWRTPDYIYRSTGVFALTPRHLFHDWKRGGHGEVDMRKSIVRSVNSYYYELAHEVGVDAMHDALARFGFGRPTRVDLDNERGGVLPTEAWKREAVGEPWYPGDTIPIGVGQGYIVATPLQLARAMAVIANGGDLVRPHVVAQVGGIRLRPGPEERGLFDPAHIALVRDALAQVTLPGGTAYSRVGKDSSYPIAGKTGTAQVARLRYDEDGRVDNEDLPYRLRDHAWFVGFAPAYNPRIVVAALVEHGGSGGRAAGPLVRALMDHYLLERRGMRFGPSPYDLRWRPQQLAADN